MRSPATSPSNVLGNTGQLRMHDNCDSSLLGLPVDPRHFVRVFLPSLLPDRTCNSRGILCWLSVILEMQQVHTQAYYMVAQLDSSVPPCIKHRSGLHAQPLGSDIAVMSWVLQSPHQPSERTK